MERENKTSTEIKVAVIGLIGVLVTAVFAYLSVVKSNPDSTPKSPNQNELKGPDSIKPKPKMTETSNDTAGNAPYKMVKQPETPKDQPSAGTNTRVTVKENSGIINNGNVTVQQQQTQTTTKSE